MKDIETTTDQLGMFLQQLAAKAGLMVNGNRLAIQAQGALDDFKYLAAQNAEAREALRALYLDTKSYIENNNLGAVHHNQSMKLAGKALGLL